MGCTFRDSEPEAARTTYCSDWLVSSQVTGHSQSQTDTVRPWRTAQDRMPSEKGGTLYLTLTTHVLLKN